MSDKMSVEQVKAALDAGIISKTQAKAMTSGAMPDVSEPEGAVFGNEDNMRFVRGFSDIFIGIGLVLLAFGAMAFAALLGGGIWYFGAALSMWIGSEYFGSKKRAHLPTLILAIAYLVFVHKGADAILPSNIAGISLSGAALTLLAMAAYYLRFRLPFCIALMAASGLILLFSLLRSVAPDMLTHHLGAVLILSGIAVFTLAMIYDMQDIGRLTRFADNAFWLHLMAAPLMVHGIAISTLVKTTELKAGFLPSTSLGKPDALFVLIAVGCLALVGLAINRRAIIASSLGYAAIAIIFLIGGTGISTGAIITLTLLLLGAGIVLLGVGWHGTRRALLKVLPRSGIFGKIFPPETAAAAK